MPGPSRLKWLVVLGAVSGLWAASAGCRGVAPGDGPEGYHPAPPEETAGLPRELDKAHLPDYVIEPPDILLINAVRVTPKPPYRIAPGDALLLLYTGETFPNQ